MSDTQTTTQVTDTEQDLKFDREINVLGRYSSIIVLALMFSIPIVVTAVYKIPVDFGKVMESLGQLMALFIPIAVIENISYYAIIGAGGVYLSSITGNILNTRLPSAIAGMKLAAVEPGSRKGDIISILSIGASCLVTLTIIFLGMLFIAKFFTPILSHPILKPGFDNIMPALLGALVIPFVIRSPKLAASPVIISIVLCLIFGARTVSRYQSYFLPVIMISSVVAARVLYMKGFLPQKPAAKKESK